MCILQHGKGDFFPLPRPTTSSTPGSSCSRRLLGVDRNAFPEEIIEAKNFLMDEYRAHEPSREAIEMAYEKIMMSDKWRLR